jgi:hypothetical protein
VKDWEIIADNLSKAGWSLGCVSALDLEGRTIWIVDAHGYGKHFIVRADEKPDCVLGNGIGDSRALTVARCGSKKRIAFANRCVALWSLIMESCRRFESGGERFPPGYFAFSRRTIAE